MNPKSPSFLSENRSTPTNFHLALKYATGGPLFHFFSWVYVSPNLWKYPIMKILVLLFLYNKTLYKHVTALYCLYLGNVDTSANHFRNALLRGQCTHKFLMGQVLYYCSDICKIGYTHSKAIAFIFVHNIIYIIK